MDVCAFVYVVCISLYKEVLDVHDRADSPVFITISFHFISIILFYFST